MAMTRLSDPTPRMTLPRALLSKALRLARSPLTAVHLVCGLAAGLACGEYFSVTRWDPALGADAYAQFLGALMPLVANAAEHARSRVAVSCDVAGGHLVIEVSDDGPGFSPAALERGCERLFTDDSSRSSRDGGRHYGLGLHAAAEAASAHGGSVSLANSPSGGAVATIAVPLCGA